MAGFGCGFDPHLSLNVCTIDDDKDNDVWDSNKNARNDNVGMLEGKRNDGGRGKHGEATLFVCVYRQCYQMVDPSLIVKMSMGQCFISLPTGYVHLYPLLILRQLVHPHIVCVFVTG